MYISSTPDTESRENVYNIIDVFVLHKKKLINGYHAA